jgi:DNA-binding NarL/FixJ family response regulator
VILMDIRMPGLDGIAATSEIACDPALAGVHVLILTTFGLDEYIFDALRAGAAGFLVKDTDAAELIRAVRVIAAGRGPAVTRRLGSAAPLAPRTSADKQQAKSNPQTRPLERTVPFASTASAPWTRQ